MEFIRRRVIRHVFVRAVFGLCAGIFVTGLSGQDYTTFRTYLRSVTEGSRWNLGPLWIDPDLRFDLTYESSIYGTYAGQPAVPDTVGTIAVPVDVHFIWRDRFILTFTEIPEYLYFFEHDEENSFNNSYALAARLLMFRRLALSGSHEFDRAKYRVSSEIETRIFEEVEANSASLFLETPRGSAIGFIGSTRRYRYQDELLPGADAYASTTLDRDEDNVRLEFYRPAGIDSSYFVNFGYTDYAFDHPQTQYRDSFSYQASAGVRFPLLGRARGLLSLGYKYFRPRDDQQEKFSGLIGNTSLDYRFARFGLRIQLVRDISFSYDSNSFYFIDSRLGAGLSFYFSRNIRLDYDISAGRGDYWGLS